MTHTQKKMPAIGSLLRRRKIPKATSDTSEFLVYMGANKDRVFLLSEGKMFDVSRSHFAYLFDSKFYSFVDS